MDLEIVDENEEDKTSLQNYSKCHTNTVVNESVRVAVRCRPLSQKEIQNNNYSIIDVFPAHGLVEIKCPNKTGIFNDEFQKSFTFDMAYDCNSTQDDVYDNSIRPLVNSVLDGFNGCVFAYGQTGTGKTYTMVGNQICDTNDGIIPKTFKQIWQHIECTCVNMQFLVTVSYLEIYLEEIKDLLKRDHPQKLEIREFVGRGIVIPNLHTVTCKNADEMLSVMNVGNKNRTVGNTNMNERSSRSHAVFSITIEMCDLEDDTVKIGKLNLVDLAGSERQSKTGTTSIDRLKEATKINRALSSLGNVISALAENSAYIPYRDSKLTRLLQNSLGGNSKTVIIANVGPANYNYEESLTTLRYAHRAKTIRNTPVKNEDLKDATLRKYRDEIKRLKALIDEQNTFRQQPNSEREVVVIEKIVTIPNLAPNREQDDENNDLLQRLRDEQKKTEELKKRLEILESQLVSGGQNSPEPNNKNLNQNELLEIDELRNERNNDLELDGGKQARNEINENTLQADSSDNMDDEYLENDTNRTNDEYYHEVCNELATLEKQLKFKHLIIDNFIPVEERRTILNKTYYNSELEQWLLLPTPPATRLVYRPTVRSRGFFDYPITNYAINRIKSNINCPYRYKHENILNLQFERTQKCTHSYYSEVKKMAEKTQLSKLEQILNDAMMMEAETADIEIDCCTDTAIVLGTNSARIQQKLDTIAKNLKTKQQMERTKFGRYRCLS